MSDPTDLCVPTQQPALSAMGHHLPPRLRVLARNSVTLIVALQTLAALGPLSAVHRAAAAGMLVALAIVWGFVTVRRTDGVLEQAALVVVVGLGAGLDVVTGGQGQSFVAGYGTLFVAPFWFGMPRALVPSVSAVVSVILCTISVEGSSVVGGIGNGVGAAFFGLAALFWGRVLQASQHNAQLVEELRRSHEAERQGAVVAERARLARELHDVLAHTLSSLSLHLESTRVLARSRDVDGEVVRRIERAVALARTGLEEARDAVGTLRDDDLPGPERLESLVADFARTSGIDARFTEVGQPLSLAPEVRVALFRSAQEALTNVGKHAHASAVEVCLTWYDDAVALRVVDDGTGIGPRSNGRLPGGGNGLRGMRERAELAGGQLEAGPTGSGFVVGLRLPVS